MKRAIIDNLKNIRGWRSSEKLVVFSVDDYGNVRLDSQAARERMSSAKVVPAGRFDMFDAVETREDLEMLFEVLNSVRDVSGRPAVFTAYTLCANADFAKLAKSRGEYFSELLPETFARLSVEQPRAYKGAWDKWQEGLDLGILRPQFHGREHLNIDLVQHKLRSGDVTLQANIANRSLIGLGEEPSMPDLGFTHAFGYSGGGCLRQHRSIIEDGLRKFKSVFGFSSQTFAPPALRLDPKLFAFVESLGVRGIDKPLRGSQRISEKVVQKKLIYLGQHPGDGHVSIVRNVVFEPTQDKTIDSVKLALSQIEAAFRWGKPAIISSHRVNFGGHIDAENRNTGLKSLQKLLHKITDQWPDVRFVSADELVEMINKSS